MRKIRQPFGAPLRQDADVSGIDLALRGRRERGHHRHLVRQQRVERRTAALIRHVHHLELRGIEKHFHRQMHRAEVPGRAIGYLAGVRFDRRDEVCQRIPRR